MEMDNKSDESREEVDQESESVSDILSRIDDDCKTLIEKWKIQQQRLKSQIELQNDDGFVDNIRYIGGVDISFPNDKDDFIHGCACLIVMSYPALELVYKDCEFVHLTSVYIPGFLAFRETEHLVTLCQRLKENQPEIYPQVILVDGNGILHTHKFGLASHLGVLLNIPTIGVSKKLFHVDKLEKNEKFIKNFQEQCKQKGGSLDLVGESGYIYGKAFRSTDKSFNPIFISQGHKVSLETCVRVVDCCCKYRIPEPVRFADQLSREEVRTSMNKHLEECGDKFEEINQRFRWLSNEVQRIRGFLREAK